MNLPYLSNSGQWVNCPGSFKLQIKYPRPKSKDAQDGIDEHSMAADILKGISVTNVPDEVKCYVEYINSLSGIRYVEEKFPFQVSEEVYLNAKIDTLVYDSANNLCTIVDYKSGRYPVSSKKNWQLMGYALAATDTLSYVTEETVFSLVIVQPRVSEFVSEWRVRGVDLRAYANILRSACISALGDKPPCLTGEWCRWCGALAYCHTSEQVQRILLQCSGYAVDPERSTEQCSRDLVSLRAAYNYLKHVIDALETRVTAALRTGESLPHWSLSPSRGSKVWSEEVSTELLKSIAAGYGVTVAEEKLITPLQAIAAGIPEELVMPFVTVKQGSMKLQLKKEYYNE